MVLTNEFKFMFEIAFSNAISENIKGLIDNKHLYQNMNVEFPAVKEVFEQHSFHIENDRASKEMENLTRDLYESASEATWKINPPREEHIDVGFAITASNSNSEPTKGFFDIRFTPPTIQTFCSICKRVQPYNFIRGEEFVEHILKCQHKDILGLQVFVMVYQCQACKEPPEVFMIRRNKTKITLCGRSPMEIALVKPIIPKSHRKYFSDAIIAFNSGQVLAGEFLLRTFVEQYVRQVTGESESQETDEIFTKYSQTLPQDFKDRFPSLSSIYSNLSVDIHKGEGVEGKFKSAREKIETHFEAKRIFKIQNYNKESQSLVEQK